MDLRLTAGPGDQGVNIRRRGALAGGILLLCHEGLECCAMLTVVGRKTSINVQKVMWAVGELGLKHERLDAGGTFGGLDTPEFAKLNPNRLVPVIDDNGFTLWESNPIVRYLARTYGWGTLSPSDEQDRARADQWMDWSITTLYQPIIVGLFLPLVRTASKDRDMKAVDASIKLAGEKLALLDAQLAGKQFLLGNQLTMADIAVGALMYRYYTLPVERPTLPNVEAWCARLAGRTAYKEHVMIDWQSMKVPGA
jgi:glutathione S-transferase